MRSNYLLGLGQAAGLGMSLLNWMPGCLTIPQFVKEAEKRLARQYIDTALALVERLPVGSQIWRKAPM